MNEKIFCIGFNKTGTTTLHSVFKDQLGYKSAHKPRWPYWTADKKKSNLDNYDSFTDGETPLINNLRERYPNAFFILNTRPLKNWLVSRHKAIERSKTATNWALTRFLPLGFIGRYINNHYLINDDKAMLRWIQIRNSYHRFVLDQFKEHERFVVLNIEDDSMFDQLRSFLNLKQSIVPALENQEGKSSVTGTILETIGREKTTVNSEIEVEQFLAKYNLSDHEETLTYFCNEEFQLSKSRADRFLSLFPFFKQTFKMLFLFFVRKRGRANSFFSKWFYDSLIGIFRSEKDLNYYTSIFQLGSGSR